MYKATKLFNDRDELFSSDRKEVAAAILEAEAICNSHDHESKLGKIEIGLAIRRVAELDESNLTDTISNLELCSVYERSRNTFLKYARVAGIPALRKLAVEPSVSFSVLDEIAAAKKPLDLEIRSEFMRRIISDIEQKTEQIRHDEGLGDTEPDKLRASGVSRNDAIGMIRSYQVEFGVPTRAVTGGGTAKDREEIKQRKNLSRISRLIRLTNCASVLLLPEEDQKEWLDREGLTWAQVAESYKSTRDKLVDDGIVKPSPIELVAGSLVPSAYLLRAEAAAAAGKAPPAKEEEPALESSLP